MTTDVKGMGLREYLGQGDYWIDDRTGSVYEIGQMDPDRRVSAARSLARMATALISLAEAEALRQGELAVTLQLARRPPREWMITTTLYRALYPPADPTVAHGNRSDRESVLRMSELPRSA